MTRRPKVLYLLLSIRENPLTKCTTLCRLYGLSVLKVCRLVPSVGSVQCLVNCSFLLARSIIPPPWSFLVNLNAVKFCVAKAPTVEPTARPSQNYLSARWSMVTSLFVASALMST